MFEDYHDELKRQFDSVDWSSDDSISDFDSVARSLSREAEWDYAKKER